MAAFNVSKVNDETIKAAHEAGAWLHLNDPEDPTSKLYVHGEEKAEGDEKPKTVKYAVEVKVKGPRSDAMKAFDDACQKLASDPDFEITPEEDARLVADLLLDWRYIEVDGSPKFSVDAAAVLLQKMTSFKMDIVTYGKTAKNFKGSASKG